jgi:hypothetical protein
MTPIFLFILLIVLSIRFVAFSVMNRRIQVCVFLLLFFFLNCEWAIESSIGSIDIEDAAAPVKRRVGLMSFIKQKLLSKSEKTNVRTLGTQIDSLVF